MSQTNVPFLGPQNNEPRTGELQGKKEEEITETSEEGSDPIRTYQDNLEEHDISLDEARKILDDVVSSGVYKENVVIGRTRVVLRTRVYEDMQRVMKALESDTPAFPVHTNDLVARYNVAACLDSYGDTTFDFPSVAQASTEDIERAFEERMRFLRSLPSPVVGVLIREVSKLDAKMEAVFSEGAPEDF